MEGTRKALLIIGVILLIAAFSFGCVGFNKYSVYDNGDHYPYEMKNAYVGGDAYNYIINGTYFTGFAVVATGFGVSGILCLLLRTLIGAMEAGAAFRSENDQKRLRETENFRNELRGQLNLLVMYEKSSAEDHAKEHGIDEPTA